MKSSDRGVRQSADTVVLRPTTATTWSSSPASAMVRRNTGRVSISPRSGSTSDGSYWTGWVYEDGKPHDGEPRNVHWPVEHTTYTAAAVILAVDALGEVAGHSTAGSGIMRGTSLAPHFTELALECGCLSDGVSGLAGRPR